MTNEPENNEVEPLTRNQLIVVYFIIWFLVFCTALMAFLLFFPREWLPWVRPWMIEYSWPR